MQVDPLILLAIYLVAVIALGVSLYALVVLKEVRDYYRAVYKNMTTRNTSAGTYSKRR